ncbi:unnamed protein product [Allacma fusca]|uniref:Tetratricopeptide repeat protein 36 n=1 Tax=Allacma fusca TaxID=39272 RepID=A0A8J2KD45_9HEXA|nr:unnamed protein product [Allacma fusca]
MHEICFYCHYKLQSIANSSLQFCRIFGFYLLKFGVDLKMATETDNDILNHIFNPLLPTGELAFDTDSEETAVTTESEELYPAETKQSKRYDEEGVRAAENGDIDKALTFFTKSIQVAPFRASGYNNRAQSYRLLGDIAAAKTDLNNAINLSGGKGRPACQAFCQRGLIYLRENHIEDARKDFEAAAKLGSQFAKAQLVQLNPYAALCNKMLRDVIGKLQRCEHDVCENNSTEQIKE